MAKRTTTVDRPFPHDSDTRWWRETIESIIVAVILAFVFRSFVAEAFVIPTGSMASTLMGRHKDIYCEQCGYNYRAGASIENPDNSLRASVDSAVCPICRRVRKFKLGEVNPDINTAAYFQEQRGLHGNDQAFNGDRILVSKFAYNIGSPKRWDVIVFKNPSIAKQNYIKRLIGLPEESIRVHRGDIFVMKAGESDFTIARKPPSKILAMLQLVHDTNYRAQELVDVNWPSRWQYWDDAGTPQMPRRPIGEDSDPISIESNDTVSWLRYQHLIPSEVATTKTSSTSDWDIVRDGSLPDDLDQRRGQLISDFACYNTSWPNQAARQRGAADAQVGKHWVGDLAMECKVKVESDSGELYLDIVEGGLHHTCRIDLSNGQATLQLDGSEANFVDEGGSTYTEVSANTRVKGKGTYRFRMSNLDDQVVLWINNSVVAFDKPTTYAQREDVRPTWSEEDPGDIAPLGIGVKGAKAKVSQLKVWRDIYYTATYDRLERDFLSSDFQMSRKSIAVHFTDTSSWAASDLFLDSNLRTLEFEIPSDQYFPMGDNSPASSDGRYWNPGEYVDSNLMIGKALVVYWPHGWNRPIPMLPNFKRMKLIR